MLVMSWNVNGLRACLRKGFLDWFEARRPAVLGIQETRVFEPQLEGALDGLSRWKFHLTPAERPGYSGTGLLTRPKPLQVIEGVGDPQFDVEGRCQVAEYPRWVFINAYFPKGSGRDRDNSRVPYKLAFYEAVLEVAQSWRERGKGVVIGGDFNTAHEEIDLKNWRGNRKTSGFLPEERAMLSRYLDSGFVDVFRERHPSEAGHYSWWSQRMGARERNVGWRIDYLLVSQELAGWVKRAFIEPDALGSDHCPVGIDLVIPRG